MKIVADCDIPFIRGVFEPFCEVVYLRGSDIGPADVRDADALIVRTRTRCGRELLESSRVRLVATATVGFDHIDTAFCAAAGIEVATAAGSNARAVLQWYAAALVFCCARQGLSPAGTTVGVVGTGNVGSLVARYSEQWGFDVMCCDPPLERKGAKPAAGQRFYGFGELAPRCDVITFHTPLIRTGGDATFHMAGGGFFDSLRPGAVIMNASRGEVADGAAWLEAVSAGRCHAAIDTWEDEPAPDPRLIEAAALSTPHIAGYSRQGKANASAAAVHAVAHRFGMPLTDWFPAEVKQVSPRAIGWDELRNSIAGYFDIDRESAVLKAHPRDFERTRCDYNYRDEYF